jgi:hypothetical protein
MKGTAMDFDNDMQHPEEDTQSAQMDPLVSAFRDQLLACLEECAHGRRGLFSEYEHLGDEAGAWPEAGRLRALAAALQSILAQSGERNALCDEFLDLCTIHGEAHPGEPRLARVFLARIEKGQAGTPTEPERKPW